MTMHPERIEPMQSSCPVIILAAGASTRLGQPKQLLRLAVSEDEVLLDRAVRLAREAGAAPIFIVLGAYAEIIRASAKLLHCTVLSNPEWEEGMANSLRVGVRAVGEQQPLALGALIMACDQPALSAEHLRCLLTTHRNSPDQVIASYYVGRSGIPAVIPRQMFPAISKLTGDQGARILFQQTSQITNIAFVDGERDLDHPDDLRYWMEAQKSQSTAKRAN